MNLNKNLLEKVMACFVKVYSHSNTGFMYLGENGLVFLKSESKQFESESHARAAIRNSPYLYSRRVRIIHCD